MIPVGHGPGRLGQGQTPEGKWPVKSSGGAPASEPLCTGAINLTNPSLLALQVYTARLALINRDDEDDGRCSAHSRWTWTSMSNRTA